MTNDQPATQCLACGTQAPPVVPGQIPRIPHQPSCRAEYDRYVQSALNALAVFREALWAHQDTGRTREGAEQALDAAETLADKVANLAGYAGRLTRQSASPSITRTAMDQGETMRQISEANAKMRALLTSELETGEPWRSATETEWDESRGE